MNTAWRRRAKLALGTTVVVVLGYYALFLFNAFTGRTPGYQGLSILKHADFIAYYTAMQMVAQGQGHHLYDLSLQTAVQAHLTGGGYILSAFVNPPFLALLLAPLAHLPYAAAFLIWDLVLLASIAGATWLLVDASGFRGINAWLAGGTAATTMSLFVILVQGQSTAFVLLGLAACYWYWRKDRMVLAGAALALCLFKPNLVLLVPLLLVARSQWRALVGFAAAAAVLVAVSAVAFGPQIWPDYLRLIVPQAAGTAQNWATGGRTQFGLLGILTAVGLSQAVALAACALLGGALMVKIARRPGSLAMDFALCVVASFVVAPHANFHDAAILVVPGLIVAGVLAHDARASLLDKLVVAGMAVVGMLIVVLPPLAVAFACLLWAVHLDYVRYALSPVRASVPSKI